MGAISCGVPGFRACSLCARQLHAEVHCSTHRPMDTCEPAGVVWASGRLVRVPSHPGHHHPLLQGAPQQPQCGLGASTGFVCLMETGRPGHLHCTPGVRGRCHQAGCRCAAAGLSAPAAWYWVPTTRKMPLLSMQDTDLPPEQGDKATSTPHNPAPPPCKLQGQMPQGPGVTSCAISPGEVSTLDHEVLDHTMEFAVFVAKSFLEKRVSG